MDRPPHRDGQRPARSSAQGTGRGSGASGPARGRRAAAEAGGGDPKVFFRSAPRPARDLFRKARRRGRSGPSGCPDGPGRSTGLRSVAPPRPAPAAASSGVTPSRMSSASSASSPPTASPALAEAESTTVADSECGSGRPSPVRTADARLAVGRLPPEPSSAATLTPAAIRSWGAAVSTTSTSINTSRHSMSLTTLLRARPTSPEAVRSGGFSRWVSGRDPRVCR